MTLLEFNKILEAAKTAVGADEIFEVAGNLFKIGDYYFYYEDIEVYTRISKLVDKLQIIKENVDHNTGKIIVLPFYIGFNHHDLNKFLGITNSPTFEIKPEFEVYPADFNISGLKVFISFLNFLDKQEPVLDGLYTADAVQEKLFNAIMKNRSNFFKILPIESQEFENGGDGIIHQIFKKVSDEISVH